jgi:phytoene desaturase
LTEIVVVGGGVGGLAAAVRLRAAGHAVRVLERRAMLGGKLDVRVRDGFTFDTGPSLLTLPDLLDELFRVAGTRLAAEVDLTRLDPQIRYRWPDGTGFDAGDDPEATSRAIEAFSPGSGPAHRQLTSRGARIWAVSERTFLAGPMSGPRDLLGRMRSPSDLTTIDPVRTLDAVARRTFSDRRLVQWAGRYATYSGSSPYRAPATLACIPAVEARYGVWYPTGGMSALRDALVRVAGRMGVELATGCEVERIDAAGGGVRAVVTSDGTRHRADVVVANVDAEVLYRDLLPDTGALHRAGRAGRSLSAFVVLAGVRGTTPGQAHHSVWFPADQAHEFRQLVDERVVADDPTIYACVPSVSDSTRAPPGHESWFLLVNAPAGAAVDRAAYGSRVLDLLAGHGTDLRDRLCFTETITPDDLASRYGAPGGAIYGSSSNGRRAAFLRPANRGPQRGLYLVGGSSHPGGGLPLVTVSGRIVADLIRQDGW